MPRIRTVKPQFWSSPNPPSFGARLLYLAMLNWADDDGVGTANPKELAAFAFPYDDEIGAAEIREFLRECSVSYHVVVYEVSGRPYYHIENFLCHQVINRPSRSRHPRPDQAERIVYPQADSNSVSPHRAFSEPSVSERVSLLPSSLLPTSVGSKHVTNASEQSLPDRGTELELISDAKFRAGRIANSFSDEAIALVPASQPEHVRGRLRIMIGELLSDGAEHDDVQRAVDRWLKRLADGEDIFPGHLRQCYSQVIAQATITPEQVNNGRTPTKNEQRLQNIQALRNKPTRKEITDADGP